ncbi:MAG: hypothetical protein K2L59_08080 [Muribaculaceae bacterium]|nr:hypothetical protein [Muribaculaceae bacterium]
MSIKSISLAKVITAVCILLTSQTAPASRQNVADPDWTFHSAFDNRPRKIVDTADAVYFFVHQTPYSATDHNLYYSTPAGAVFFLDKNAPEAGLQDLHRVAPLSGADMRMFAADPVTGLAVIAYSDGGIDLVTRDHKVTYFSEIRDRSFPGASVINSISFDPASHNVWISAGTGYLSISASTLSLLQNVEWGVSVSDICPVGSSLIAIIDGAMYEAKAGSDIARRESFSAISGATTGVAGIPLHIFPLGEGFFGYVTSTGAVIKALRGANGSWSREAFVNDGAILQNAANIVSDRTEHTIIPTSKGYYVSSASKAYLISNAGDDGSKPVMTTVALPSGSTFWSCSYDHNTFWAYRERGEFVCRQLSGSTWTELGVYKTASPLVCKDIDFTYSPLHGLVAVNREPGKKIDKVDTVIPVLTAAYSNGKWTNLSPAHNRPYYADENATFLSTWNSQRNLYPLGNPMGSVVDPLFPDYMHSGSNWCGIASTNLTDPREYPILSTVSTYAFAKFPCQTDLERQNWGTFTGTYCAGFDADNVLWVFRSTGYDYTEANRNNIVFRYWTPEARRASLESGDPSLAGNWKEIYVTDKTVKPLFWTMAKALKHPANKGKLAASFQDCAERGTQLNGSAIVIYDHKGTLDNSADDTLNTIFRLRLENGSLMTFGYVNDIQEDPLTGELILMTYTDTFIIDPSVTPENGIMPARILSVKSDVGPGCEFLSPITATSACFDEYNRLWVAAQQGGVIGMNADRTEMIAHFTTQNSPIPSDGVYGICWNPDTKSLFMSTDLGIAEVRVDAPEPVRSGILDPFITPETVGPAYAGTVAIHNIPAGATLKVADADGKTVANVPDAVNGTSYWDLRDRSGRRVPTGRYTVMDATATTDFPAMTVTVTR